MAEEELLSEERSSTGQSPSLWERHKRLNIPPYLPMTNDAAASVDPDREISPLTRLVTAGPSSALALARAGGRIHVALDHQPMLASWSRLRGADVLFVTLPPSADEPDQRDELHRLLQEWRAAVGAPVPERK